MSNKPTERRTKSLLRKIADIDCQLSPENLNHDGLRPRHEADAAFKSLSAQRRVLVTELGHEPTWAELNGK